MLFESTGSNGIEKAQRAQTVHIACIFRHFEGNFNVGLSAKIVDLCGLNLGDNIDQVGAVTEVTVVKMEFGWTCIELLELEIDGRQARTFVLVLQETTDD